MSLASAPSPARLGESMAPAPGDGPSTPPSRAAARAHEAGLKMAQDAAAWEEGSPSWEESPTASQGVKGGKDAQDAVASLAAEAALAAAHGPQELCDFAAAYLGRLGALDEQERVGCDDEDAHEA